MHALLGGNGAGKSTLIKCITGIYNPESGFVKLDGKDITRMSPTKMSRAGISTVYQEVNLIPTQSIAENIFLGRQPKRFGLIDRKRMIATAQRRMKELNIDVDVTKNLDTYSVAIQQMVAIARGVDMSAKVLILDEPTASLDGNEVEQLFVMMRSLAEKGIGIIFVTHFLDQVYQVTDRITILRNGTYVTTEDTASLSQESLVRLMLNQPYQRQKEKQEKVDRLLDNDEIALEATRFGKERYLSPLDFSVRKGSIYGIAGLLGSGRTELAKLLFGLVRPDSGQIKVFGDTERISSPRDAVRAGIALCPEDRKSEGIIPDLSVKDNIILALQARRGVFSKIPDAQKEEMAKRFIRDLNIVTSHWDTPVKNLSGGNQQKVILARWLCVQPTILILDEPTRGIDVGAKSEIKQIISGLCEQGVTVILISSELEEITESSDQVLVMKDKHAVTVLSELPVSTTSIIEAIGGNT
ncbi:sugar ABC transporter ATP-binding protein [Grimontia sp. NTOU-MAR1]|uniref:sugar ABC transporter ATP-binding protein n=1 Tax=Grimontia sp. NTOU-MAR1 TaxID=3111011 RepID=UPI002DBDEE75|nr:sugar ABC transporter ATP-binding protein [Grimontia sp. NTOU-MAR1]WRW01065.1 sugar ABC transporter ATP-binding protein [Grimontia sp. NTOU-MAR1]